MRQIREDLGSLILGKKEKKSQMEEKPSGPTKLVSTLPTPSSRSGSTTSHVTYMEDFGYISKCQENIHCNIILSCHNCRW